MHRLLVACAASSVLLMLGLGGSGLSAASQVSEAGSLVVPRKGHTATVLNDGRVLIVGGRDAAGELASAELFDPTSRSFSWVGAMETARSGHAATLLPDGRVLVTGGTGATGALASAEIFDPEAMVSFSAVASSMGAARVGHTATLMADGRVLIAGGDAAGTAEWFDSATGSFPGALIAMTEIRSRHTATAVGDGLVLVAGGGSNTVEFFDAAEGTFAAWPRAMNEVRIGHSAVANADDTVLMVGGESAGTLENFDPSATEFSASIAMGAPGSVAQRMANDRVLVLGPATAGVYDGSNGSWFALPELEAPALHRDGQTATELAGTKEILVVGGSDSSEALVGIAATYNPARLETDKADYYPEEEVIVTGTGWKAGEEVDLFVVDDLGWTYDSTVVADSAGDFVTSPFFVVLWQHLDVTFDLTSYGVESGLSASHTFTDSSTQVRDIRFFDFPATFTVGVADGPIKVRTTRDNGNAETLTGSNSSVTIQLTSDSSTGSFSTSVGGTFSTVLNLTIDNSSPTNPAFPDFYYKDSTAGTVTLTATVTAKGTGLSNLSIGDDDTLVTTVVAANTSTSLLRTIGTSPSVYGDALEFTATVSSVSGTPTGTVNFKDGATVIGSGVLTAGVAIFDASGLAVAGSPYGITAEYLSDGNFSASTSTPPISQVISPKTVIVTPTSGQSKTYGDPNSVLTYTLSEAISFTGALDRAAGETVGNYPINLGTLASASSNHELALAAAPVNFEITQKAASVTPDAASKTYGDADPAFTGTLSGFLLTDAVTATYSRTAGETVLGSPYTISADLDPDGVLSNYDITYKTADFTISKADAVISVTGYSVTFDANSHTATGTATGGLGEDLSGLLDLSGTTHTNAGSYPSDPWSFPGDANHNPANGTVANSIAKADAVVTVTGYSGTYDAAAHGATGSATGVALDPTAAGSSLDLGTSFTDVPGGTANWTFTGGTNYNDQNGSVAIDIAKANAVVTVTGYTGTYDAAAHGASGSATGVALDPTAAGSTLDLGASFTDVPGGTANWTFTGGTNYNDQNGSVEIEISKADANVSVTGYTGVYDAAPHGATGTATGVGGVDLSADLNLGATFTDVLGGTANWTFTGGTNYLDESGLVEIVISKADAVIDVDGYTGVYDGAAHGATGTATGVQGENLAGLDLGATFTNVPGGTANWAFTDVTGNYNDDSGSADIVIMPATAVIDVQGYSVEYDGNPHGLSGTATGVGATDLSSFLSFGAAVTDVPGGSISWSFDAGANYSTASGSAVVTISKAPSVTVVTIVGGPFTYNGLAHTPATVSVTGIGGLNLTPAADYANNVNAGTATASYTYAGDANHNGSSDSKTFEIEKANAVISVPGYAATYDGLPHTSTGTATGADASNLSSLLDLSGTTHIAAGDYPTDPWSFAGDANHNPASGTTADSIAKANATIVVTPYSVTYDANLHTSAASATGVQGEPLAGLDVSATTHIAAGSYIGDLWTFTDVTGNYNDDAGTVDNAIAKANATIVTSGYTGVYDGAAHGAMGSATGVLGETLVGLDLGASFTDVPGGTAFWTFTDVTGNYNNDAGNESIVITPATAVIDVQGYSVEYDGNPHDLSGTATGVGATDLSSFLSFGAAVTDVPGGSISWSFDAGANYNTDSGSVTVTITKAPSVTVVTIVGGPFTYNGLAHTPAAVSVTGIGGLNLTPAADYANNVNAGTATASYTYAGDANHNGSSDSKTFEIEKAIATISVAGFSGVYDGTAHGVVSSSATGVNSESLTGLVIAPTTYTDVPGGSIDWTFSNANYADASGSATVTITKADATISVVGYSGIYDAVPHGATGMATGVSAEDLSGDLDLGASFTNVPGGTANWTFTDSTGNYNNASGSVAIVITKADATFTVTGYSATYDGLPHTASVSTITGVNGETGAPVGSVDVSATTHTNAGSYLADAWTFTGGANYNDDSGTVDNNIDKAVASVTANPKSKAYGDVNPALNATVVGEIGGGDAINYSLSTTATQFSGVGGYPIEVTLGANPNYDVSSTDSTLTIDPAVATVTANPKSKTYGEVNPALTATVVGEVSGGDVIIYSLSTTATQASGVAGSPYDIIVTLGSNPNYDMSSTDSTLTINKADATIVVTPYNVPFDGDPHTSTGTATGALGEDLSALLDLSGTTHTLAGTFATDPWTFAGDANHNPASGTVSNSIGALEFTGFLNPIDGVSPGAPKKTFKLGSTIPVKFSLKSDGVPFVTGVHTIQVFQISNGVTGSDPITIAATDSATTGNQFRLTDGQWHFNLSTKSGFSKGTWLVRANLADGNYKEVVIELSK